MDATGNFRATEDYFDVIYPIYLGGAMGYAPAH